MTLDQFAFRKNERFIAGGRRAPAEDSGGAEEFMDRQVPESAEARAAVDQVRKLRAIAKLLDDPALDDATLRARTREILAARRKPDFDRRTLNDALLAEFGSPHRQPEEAVHGDSHPIDH